MAIRYTFNPLSAEIEMVDRRLPEEEFFSVNPALVTSKTIALSYPEEDKSERVLLNGLELSEGATRDYIITNGVIVFSSDLLVDGDNIKVNYLRKY